MGKGRKQKTGSIGALIEQEHRSPRRKGCGCLSRGIMSVIGLIFMAVALRSMSEPLPNVSRATEKRTSAAFVREVQATASAPASKLTLMPSQTRTVAATSRPAKLVTATATAAQQRRAAGLFATATPKSTETAQPTATATHTVTARATATETPSPTSTPTATRAAASATPAPRLATGTVYTNSAANLRECPRTDCEIVAALGGGIGLPYDARVDGEIVSAGNAIWYRVTHAARTAYVYSGVVSTSAPAPVVNFQAAAPLVSTPNQQVGGTWNCNGDQYNCPYFQNRCADLWTYWAACPGDPSKLDREGDGRPCESTCP